MLDTPNNCHLWQNPHASSINVLESWLMLLEGPLTMYQLRKVQKIHTIHVPSAFKKFVIILNVSLGQLVLSILQNTGVSTFQEFQLYTNECKYKQSVPIIVDGHISGTSIRQGSTV